MSLRVLGLGFTGGFLGVGFVAGCVICTSGFSGLVGLLVCLTV